VVLGIAILQLEWCSPRLKQPRDEGDIESDGVGSQKIKCSVERNSLDKISEQ
jgi:hypothetical protein